MSDPPNGSRIPSENQTSASGTSHASAKQNPALRMLGIPNFKFRLPSRNWLIFLSITSAFTAAYFYDRHHKRKNQTKWATLISYLQDEHLSTKEMPRKLTVFLAASPGDGLRIAREHFHEYVRPVLEKGGVDWDVIEGRREGDVRAGLAERIRRKRRKAEGVQMTLEEEKELGDEALAEEAVEMLRQQNGVSEWKGEKGDIVIGRNTWKEYVRGLHEGWLGPLHRPIEESEAAEKDKAGFANSKTTSEMSERPSETASTPVESLEMVTASEPASANDDASPSHQNPEPTEPNAEEKKSEDESKPKKPTQIPPSISTSDYSSVSLPQSIPDNLGPASVIPYPHILGFLNTPIRIRRFLSQRYLADAVGREVAAAVLGSSRPFSPSSASTPGSGWDSQTFSSDSNGTAKSAKGSEQEAELAWEERDWPKITHKEWEKRWKEDDEKGERRAESIWLDEMVMDGRISERMRRFRLEMKDEERAERIGEGREGIKGRADAGNV
ncbi:MAG: mitochondrial import inner membrane translocase subunit tim54 [Bogoriella megaspora]|nr:MAG: mitochondrial import inner membrane translocase subunit tim54 [Bogoriella megaspora]